MLSDTTEIFIKSFLWEFLSILLRWIEQLKISPLSLCSPGTPGVAAGAAPGCSQKHFGLDKHKVYPQPRVYLQQWDSHSWGFPREKIPKAQAGPRG